MKYTNNLNFPKYIFDFLVNDNYDHTNKSNTFSATTLLKPIKVYWLTIRNDDDLVMDVSDLAASRIGTAIHDSIEKVETEGVEKELRLERKITIDGIEYTIRGKFDILEKQQDGSYTLRDIKTTSVWAKVFGSKDEEYKKQLSIYRWLLQSTDKKINDVAFIDFFFTDWQKSKTKTDDNYPPHKVNPGYKVPLMTLEETERFIIERVKGFVKYKDAAEKDLPACDIKDLWATEAKWAVMKKRATRATKLCDSQVEAEMYIRDRKVSNAFVEYRPPKVKRCRFCSSFPFCAQGQDYANRKLIQY